MIRRSMVFMVAAMTTAGCTPAPSMVPVVSPSGLPSSASPGAILDEANGISFDRPAGWLRSQPNEHDPINDGPLIYLSTDSLLPACARPPEATPNPAGTNGRACDWPLAELAPNGVLVTWLTTRILQPLPSDGEGIKVNGVIARMKTTRPGGCARIGADETIELLVPIGQPLSNLAVVACVRGPDLARAEAAFRAMLTSARFAQRLDGS